jgi:peroxiredoxin
MTRNAIAVVVLLAAASSMDCRAASLEGKPAPAAEVKLLDGTPFRLADAKGQVVVLNFWATWCVPCRAEMPAIDAYFRRHRDDGLKIIAITVDEPKDETKVRDVMKPFAFSAALMREASVKGYGRIWRIPLTFVIDRQGVLRKDEWYGDPGLDEAALERVVTPLLQAR